MISRADQPYRVLLWAIACTIVCVWLFVVVSHVNDRFGLNHVSGAWVSLGEFARAGELYPPLVRSAEPISTGGTRFMPVPILVQAALSSVVGSSIAAGKIANATATLLMCLAVWASLRRLAAPVGVAALLASMLLLTQPVWETGTTIRYDALAAGLQMWAVFLALSPSRQLSDRVAMVIGALCAAAFLCKFSAIWAGVGIGLSLLFVQRRAGLICIATGLLVMVLGLVLAHALSAGRIWENVLGLAFAGSDVPSAEDTPGWGGGVKRGLIGLSTYATASAVLLPIAAWKVFTALRDGFGFAGKRLDTIEPRTVRVRLALLGSAGIAAFVVVFAFRDVGVASNHLIDAIVLLPLLAAMPSASGHREPSRFWLAVCAIGLVGAGVWFGAFGGVRTIGEGIVAEPLRASGRLDPTPLSDRFDASDRILSEDPLVPLMLGTMPEMLDAFMVIRIEHHKPGTLDAYAREVAKQNYAAVVLLRPIHDPFSPGWYERMQMGGEITSAVQTWYRFDGIHDGYAVYLPKEPGSSDSMD